MGIFKSELSTVIYFSIHLPRLHEHQPFNPLSSITTDLPVTKYNTIPSDENEIFNVKI